MSKLLLPLPGRSGLRYVIIINKICIIYLLFLCAKFFKEYGLKFYKYDYVSNGLDSPSPHVSNSKHLADPLPPPLCAYVIHGCSLSNLIINVTRCGIWFAILWWKKLLENVYGVKSCVTYIFSLLTSSSIPVLVKLPSSTDIFVWAWKERTTYIL